MTSAELLELGRQMTPRPWRDEPEPRTAGGWRAVLSGQAEGPGATIAQWLLPGDAAGIVALANHAGPLADLVVAVERLRGLGKQHLVLSTGAHAVLEQLFAALAGVHATPPGDTP